MVSLFAVLRLFFTVDMLRAEDDSARQTPSTSYNSHSAIPCMQILTHATYCCAEAVRHSSHAPMQRMTQPGRLPASAITATQLSHVCRFISVSLLAVLRLFFTRVMLHAEDDSARRISPTGCNSNQADPITDHCNCFLRLPFLFILHRHPFCQHSRPQHLWPYHCKSHQQHLCHRQQQQQQRWHDCHWAQCQQWWSGDHWRS